MAIRIAYVGPPLAGKTANIQAIAKAAPSKPRLQMRPTAADREHMLFVNVPLPLRNGDRLEVQLATLPGAIIYESSWNAVLLRAQGIVFVADSQRERVDSSREQIAVAERLLRALEADPAKMPWVFQANKRDLPNVLPLEEMSERLGHEVIPATANANLGVIEALRACIEKLPDADAKHVDWGVFRSPVVPQ